MLHEDTYDRYANGELQLKELFDEVNGKVVDEDLFDKLVGIGGVEYTCQDCSDHYGGFSSCLYEYNLFINNQQVTRVYNEYML